MSRSGSFGATAQTETYTPEIDCYVFYDSGTGQDGGGSSCTHSGFVSAGTKVTVKCWSKSPYGTSVIVAHFVAVI